MMRCCRRFAAGSSVFLAVWLVGPNCFAGGGPENVLLVVNANSKSSRTIANHYIRLRRIPASHVLYIDWKGGVEVCKGERFRTKLLEPILNTINKRKLALQIDYVVYSSGFPWRVDLRGDFPDTKAPRQMTPVASLTGATYLWQFVQLKHPGFTTLHSNWYLPGGVGNNLSQCQQLGQFSTRSQRFSYIWTQNGKRAAELSKGQRYLMSAMLGVTSGRGNSTDEVISYLTSSAAADATHPKGTFYFMKNNDIRSTTRDACFDEVATRLRKLGVGAEVLQGKFPQRRADVLGVVTGAAKINVTAARNTFLPGAICDNLTSLGGVLIAKSKQTPLTEYLRAGASAACGTVVEPFAIQAKFPLASLPLHYVGGCSLGEAFYQSVAAPYQLLIVGDPLCQPWAAPPVVSATGVEPGDIVSGIVNIKPTASLVANRKVRFLELHVDGVLQSRALEQKFAEGIQLDTTKLVDGYHEITVVAVDQHPVEAQGRLVVPVIVKNRSSDLKFQVAPPEQVRADTQLRLSASQVGATGFSFYQNLRKLGGGSGEQVTISIPAGSLGRGPVALQVRSEGEAPQVSPPVWLNVLRAKTATNPSSPQ